MGAEKMQGVLPLAATTAIVINGDQRFWDIPNLYAIDGSVFPTAGGNNPTLTIEGLAWRAAEGIAKRHGYRR